MIVLLLTSSVPVTLLRMRWERILVEFEAELGDLLDKFAELGYRDAER